MGASDISVRNKCDNLSLFISQVQQMNQTLFPCPHCDAKYPFKKVLIDRNVRCTHCRNAFSLQKTGVAKKIQSGHQRAREEGDLDESSASLEEVKAQALQRIRKQELMKKKLADTLSDAAMSAFEAEIEKDLQSEKKRASSENTKHPAGTNIIQTNQSQREHKRMRLLFYLCASCLSIGIITIIYFSLKSNSPQQLALDKFSQDPPYALQGKPSVIEHYHNLMWYAQAGEDKPQPIITNVDQGTWTSSIETFACDYGTLFKELSAMTHMHRQLAWKPSTQEYNLFYSIKESENSKQMQDIQTKLSKIPEFNTEAPVTEQKKIPERSIPDIWISEGKEELARSLWWDKQSAVKDEAMLQNVLKSKGVKTLLKSEIKELINTQTPDDRVATFIMHIFSAATDLKGNHKWQKKMLAGTGPDSVSVIHFSGSDGRMIKARGARLLEIPDTRYSAMLIKCEALDPDWRVFRFEIE